MSKEAMKLALEALEYIEHNYMSLPALAEKAITALREALAERPEQESVAWRNAALRVGEDLCSVGPFGYYNMTAEQWLDWALSVVTVHAPPTQRTWVVLTDDEVIDIAGSFDYRYDVARAAEAKLKEKNT